MRLMVALLLKTRTSAAIANNPWNILSTAVHSSPRTARRQEAGMVLLRIRRTRSARSDDKEWYHRRESSTRPSWSDPSQLVVKDRTATPRLSTLTAAKSGPNIDLPIPRHLKTAQGSTKNFSAMRISSPLTDVRRPQREAQSDTRFLVQPNRPRIRAVHS